MRIGLLLITLMLSTATFAEDIKKKETVAQKLVSMDGTEQGLQNTDKMIIEKIRMRLPKDIPEQFYVDLSKNLNSEKRKQFIVQRYVETFNQKELEAALKFYESAEGKAWAKKASGIGGEIAHFTTQDARAALNTTMQQHADHATIKKIMMRMNPQDAQHSEKTQQK